MEWDTLNNNIFIGTLEGKIYSFDINTQQKTKHYHLRGSVTCLRVFSTLKENSYLMASTTKGLLSLFKIKDDSLIIFHCFVAHEPIRQINDPKFGSLQHWAEIWSLSVNINSKLNQINENEEIINIVSCSEDQTIKIWEYNLSNENPKLKKSFKYHKLAVTCVDWKVY